MHVVVLVFYRRNDLTMGGYVTKQKTVAYLHLCVVFVYAVVFVCVYLYCCAKEETGIDLSPSLSCFLL